MVCSADGSFFQKGNDVKAGIGGVVWDNVGRLKYIFSGPVQVNSAVEAEVEALEYLVAIVHSVSQVRSKILFCSDSIAAVNLFIKRRLYGDLQQLFPMNSDVIFKHVTRDYNIEADRLAKEGSQRAYLLGAWV